MVCPSGLVMRRIMLCFAALAAMAVRDHPVSLARYDTGTHPSISPREIPMRFALLRTADSVRLGSMPATFAEPCVGNLDLSKWSSCSVQVPMIILPARRA